MANKNEQLDELIIRLNNHCREHIAVVSKEGWKAGQLKRSIIKKLRKQINDIKKS